jgi:hypothetical protein
MTGSLGQQGSRRLPIKPEISDNGKEESYERNPGGVSFVFNLSFSELLRVQKNLLSLSKTLFRQAAGALDSKAPGAASLHLEALAVGALHLGGVGLVGAHLDGGQAAVVVVLAMVGAVADGTFDALVGGAGAAAVGTILSHKKVLLHEVFWRDAEP